MDSPRTDIAKLKRAPFLQLSFANVLKYLKDIEASMAFSKKGKKKGKAIPVTSRGGP
jgi:hypothetical protein